MRYFIAFLLIAIVWLIGASLYMYDIKDHGYTHDVKHTPKFENVIVDVRNSFLGLEPDQVVCFRESHKNFYIFTVILMGIILGLVAYGFVAKTKLNQSLQRKNLEIESQKSQIEKSNQNLIASLTYASRMQQAFLPSEIVMKQCFSNYFLLNSPRDIVSGDFFWVGKVQSKTLVCLGDCTGHGVPGALMTMTGFSLLNSLTPLFINNPSQLMMEIHLRLIQNLDRSDEDVTDGMDLALIVINEMGNKIQWVSAHHNAIHISEGILAEWKGERRGLGPAYKSRLEPFTVLEIELKESDSIFLFSDGITDQFGGPGGKKFSKRRLLELVQQNSSKPFEIMGNEIKREILSWKVGNPQTDDMLFLGFRI